MPGTASTSATERLAIRRFMYSSSGIHCPVEASITSTRSQVMHARVRAVPVNTAGVSS